jgi:prenyltransferase beta subunit
MKRLALLSGVLLLLAAPQVHAQADKGKDKDDDHAKALAAVRHKGLEWLTKNQAANGSWGGQYNIAVTSFACLSYLNEADEPFDNANTKALLKGLKYLISMQKDGMFQKQGHSWIHGQGFGALALSEAYGRSLVCKVKPDIDTDKLKEVVAGAVKWIAKHQSDSGGWWYEPGHPNQHEGSTTVCAVQALVSAKNFGIAIDEKVLDKGFTYLKKCQEKDGGFNYQLGDGRSMREGSCAAVATLGLMQKFDFAVMINGYKFMLKVTPQQITKENWPEYGHFYGCMGMRLLGQEYADDKEFREKTSGYIKAAQKDMMAWQSKDGSFPLRGWVQANGGENQGYSTAYAVLALSVTEGRLSILNRDPPMLPKK